METIQENFRDLKPFKSCSVGRFVLARFKEDKVIYRAQVRKADDANSIGKKITFFNRLDFVP